MPSCARLRQRFDEQAPALTAAADDCLVPLFSNLKAPITALPRATALAGSRRLLVTLDGAHDAAANREQLDSEHVDDLIKWNPRGEDPQAWSARAEREGRFVTMREDKRVATFDETVEWTFEDRTYTVRRVVRLIERTADRHGQPLLFPALELEGWWTNRDGRAFDPDALIALYRRRGTSEQYHSEFKTDLDLERLPSGKLDTDALVLALAAIACNLLRYIGQDTLIGPDAPIRRAVHRRRLRTVLQQMIYKAARLVRHGRRYVLRFSRGDPGYTALARCYTGLVGA